MRWLPEAIGIVGFLTNVWANLLIARKSESVSTLLRLQGSTSTAYAAGERSAS